jgi:hypothetical protein
LRVEQGRHGVCHPVHQRHLEEISGSSGSARMEEGKASAVGRQPPAQVVPPANFVHRLVHDDLLQQIGGRVPVDSSDLQEAGVEPRRQQVTKSWSTASSSVCRRFNSSSSSRMRRIVAVPPGARFSRRSNSWRGGSDGDAELRQIGSRRIAAYAFAAASTASGSGENSVEQGREESRLFLVVQFPVQIQGDLGQRTRPAASPRSDNNFLQLLRGAGP